MIAASTELDLARLLLDLLIVLVAAKVAAELAERVKVPAVLGEIVAGILIGPSVLGLVELGGERGVSVSVLAEIGVLLLLMSVGMEMDLAELGKVGRASLLVAVVGVVVPFAAGVAAGFGFGESSNTAIFFGAALTATSVGITARVFGDLRALATTEARIVLGAAVADDVLGLIILTVVVKVVTGGSVGVGTVAGTLGLALLFLAGTGVVGLLLVPRLLDVIHRRATSGATLTVAALAVTLGFAQLADLAKLAFIIGAFMAGLAVGASDHHERIARDLGAVGNVFIPVFFLQIGINADLEAMAKPSVLGMAAVMSVLAVAGKLVAAVGAFGTRSDKVLIGIGMVPRGEVGLIFASIGLANGVLEGDQYGALLLVVLVTTVITPPLLRMRLGRDAARDLAEAVPATDEPEGGWLVVENGALRVHGVPPVALTIPLALRTAMHAADSPPSDELLAWFADHRAAPLGWDPADTAALAVVARMNEPRAWRLLDVTGVLERALPEVSRAMVRRRADMSDLDPLGALRFPTVDRLAELGDEIDADLLVGNHADDLVLAALVADVAQSADDVDALAHRILREADADRVASIVTDAHLLLAGLGDPGAFDERAVLQLATHLATVSHARHAYALGLALQPLSHHTRDAFDERYRRVIEALEHPEVTGGEATNLAAARRTAAQRMSNDGAVRERLAFASSSYLLAHDPEELARQAQLLEPLPRPGVVRVAVSPEPEADRWKVDVACRDAHGLLSRLTEVLHDQRLSIVRADIATWPDGAVLDSFVVHAAERPSPRTLGLAFETRLRGPLHAMAMPSLHLSFDNDALPWHTACTVSGPDEPGALQAVAAAFAEAKLEVHAARIATRAGTIEDRFGVTDRLGRKLDAAAIERVRALLAGTAKRRRLPLVGSR